MHSSKSYDNREDTYTLKNQHLYYVSACTDLRDLSEVCKTEIPDSTNHSST